MPISSHAGRRAAAAAAGPRIRPPAPAGGCPPPRAGAPAVRLSPPPQGHSTVHGANKGKEGRRGRQAARPRAPPRPSTAPTHPSLPTSSAPRLRASRTDRSGATYMATERRVPKRGTTLCTSTDAADMVGRVGLKDGVGGGARAEAPRRSADVSVSALGDTLDAGAAASPPPVARPGRAPGGWRRASSPPPARAHAGALARAVGRRRRLRPRVAERRVGAGGPRRAARRGRDRGGRRLRGGAGGRRG